MKNPPEMPTFTANRAPQTVLDNINKFLDEHGSDAPQIVAQILEEQSRGLKIPQKPLLSRIRGGRFDQSLTQAVEYLNELLDKARNGDSISDECREANVHIGIRRLHIEAMIQYKARLIEERNKFQQFIEILVQIVLRYLRELIKEYGQQQVQVMLNSAAEYRAAISGSHNFGDWLLTFPARVGLAFLRQKLQLEELEDLFGIKIVVRELPDKADIQLKQGSGSPAALIGEYIDELKQLAQRVEHEIREDNAVIDRLQTFLVRVYQHSYTHII